MTLRERQSGIYSEMETENASNRAEREWVAARRVMTLAMAHSGEFQARMRAVGLTVEDVRSPDDWVAIPPLPKKDLISFQKAQGLAAMLSGGIGELARIYMSPGPIFDPEGRGYDHWGWTEGFFAAGFRRGDVVQMTFGYHLTPAGLMLEEPLRELGCAVIPAGPGNTETQIELLTRLPVTGFVGMASYLKVIKDKARAMGLDPKKDFKLEAAFVAAERLPESLRSELEEEIGMVVRQGYGTADVGCIAYEGQVLGGMHLSSRCLVEICDPATGLPVPEGELGQVVVTPFTENYPLVRLATGDLSRLETSICPCGRTSPRLAGILGRVDDTAKVKGQFIYPHQVAEVVQEFPSIVRWQVKVSNPGGKDALAVKLVLSGTLDVKAFAVAFQAKLKLRPEVETTTASADLPEGSPPLMDTRTYR